MGLTKTIPFKRPLSNEVKNELLNQIVVANKIIVIQTEELKAHREAVKDIVDQQSEIIDSCCTKAEMGFTIENLDCVVSYEKGVAKYTDIKTGEVVDEHEMTESEQYELTDRIDVDKLLREDSDKG